MSSFKNFAVVGVGNIGGPIVEELLKAKATGVAGKTVIFSRPESSRKLEAYTSKGAAVVSIADYSDISSMTDALAGIDVVISTLSFAALRLQLPIAQAAEAAGARLFIPSEFGMPTDTAKEGLLAAKAALVRQLREIIPTTPFFTGSCSDIMWLDIFNLNLKSGKVAVGGDGNARISFTSRLDIARFVVYVLTTHPPEKMQNKTIRIEAERSTLNNIFKAYERKHNTTLEVEYISIEKLRKNLVENPRDIASIMHLMWAEGIVVVGDALDTGMYPDWNPTLVMDYL